VPEPLERGEESMEHRESMRQSRRQGVTAEESKSAATGKGGGWREEEEDKGDPGDSDSGFQARVQTASFALKDRLGCRAAYRSDASETA
jgi:hypothetical protein